MDLILWRHAEAQEPREGQSDLDRPLTPKGERQAHRMAQWLNQRLPESTRILVSPAVRTQQTAQALERRFRTVDAIAPDASAQTLLETVRWPAARDPVLVVGHQPTLGLALSRLLGGDPLQSLAVRKGGVWWLRSRDREGGEMQLLVLAVQSPECT
jgi:phosphohistidine phosphatase